MPHAAHDKAACGALGERRGQSRSDGPHGVHTASAAGPRGRGGSPPTAARDLDMVVASNGIPQDVVVLGLDCGRAAGVHSIGRPGCREDPEGVDEATESRPDRRPKPPSGGKSPEHSQLSSPPLRPATRDPDAARLAAFGTDNRRRDGRTGDRRGGRPVRRCEEQAATAHQSSVGRSGCPTPRHATHEATRQSTPPPPAPLPRT